jgi:hypothetical protein
MVSSPAASPALNLFAALTNRDIVRIARTWVKRIGDAR